MNQNSELGNNFSVTFEMEKFDLIWTKHCKHWTWFSEPSPKLAPFINNLVMFCLLVVVSGLGENHCPSKNCHFFNVLNYDLLWFLLRSRFLADIKF